MIAADWIGLAIMVWLVGCWFALIWHEGRFRRAMAWPFDLLNYLTSRNLSRRAWHGITWTLVAIAVLRTFNIL